MTIRRIDYNEMECDAGCGTVVKVWWGAPVLKEWTRRNEGPSGVYGGKPGGYIDRDYCPPCARAGRFVATTPEENDNTVRKPNTEEGACQKK